MEKTIKQIADELGIDKQKVYRFVKKNCIKEVHHEALQKNSVKHYDEAAQNLIKQGLLDESASDEAHHEVLQSVSNETVVDVLLKQSEMLQEELKIKNEQIKQLNDLVTEQQRTIEKLSSSAAAALENTTKSQLAENMIEGQKLLQDSEKKPFWKKWFK